VLNYTETTVVTPNTVGIPIQQLAYDFLQAERVTLPVSSQDVSVSGSTLTITLTGSNALQVLGAAHDIVIPAGFVQDSLSFQWPSGADQNYTYTTPGINRPFVRVDKKINEDRINPAAGSMTMPHILASYIRVVQTNARLDCRTPNSIVRYNVAEQAYNATGATTNAGTTGGTSPGNYWRNDGAANQFDYLTQPALNATGGGTSYNNFATSITVGNNAEEGYIWRISARSYASATATSTICDLYEEMAFRTVLTYELANITSGGSGQLILDNGDQLWIRGGDAIGSSSIPGFPLNWQDDYGKLNTEKKRTGTRLLQKSPNAANFNTASVWRYITWEINVRTWHDVVLGRNINTATAQAPNDAWQYGPRQWAYQRGGWSSLKDDYSLYPGKHRWVRITNTPYDAGDRVNFSAEFSTRAAQTSVTYTQPTP
jgi:hypothetical protein